MMKIAIAGKANSGKNTVAKCLKKYLSDHFFTLIAFADPIKEMIEVMFPDVPKDHLYGSSQLRNNIIPNAYKNNQPLTIRECLIDLGMMGRSYDENKWVKIFNQRAQGEFNCGYSVIATDLRFINEFQSLKEQNYYLIKLLRDESPQLDYISETQQDQIPLTSFHYILNNNNTLQDLEQEIQEQIIPNITALFHERGSLKEGIYP